jgi:hypothetical protein
LNISVHEAEKLSLEGIGRFVEASEEIRFESENRKQVYGWVNQLQVETLSLKEMRQRPVVVAGGLEDDAHRMLQAMKEVSKQPELGCGVGQDHALAVLPARRFDQNVVTQLGYIDGYQNDGRLSRLNKGHGWFSPEVKVGIRSA